MRFYNIYRHGMYEEAQYSMPVIARYGTGGGNIPIVMQKVTGTLNPGGHPGSYNGQDAYNDLLVVDNGNVCDKSSRLSYESGEEPGSGIDLDRPQRPTDSDDYQFGGGQTDNE